MVYYCQPESNQCSDKALQLRSFQLACLYQFLRETACDVRDIGEDTAEGLNTLPVKLGKQNTMLLISLVGILLDLALTQSIIITADGIIVRYPQLIYSFLRIGSTIAAYSLILRYPRENVWAWGTMSLFGLTPVLFAQAALRS